MSRGVREMAAKKKRERQEESAARQQAKREKEEAMRLVDEEQKRLEQVCDRPFTITYLTSHTLCCCAAVQLVH